MDPISAAVQLFDSPSRTFAVHLWDGSVLPPGRDERIRGQVVLTRPAALGTFVPPVSELRLADAYLDGEIELVGDAISLLEAAARWEGPRARGRLAPALLTALVQRVRAGAAAEAFARLGTRLHSLSRDRDAVRHHYDVSNEFYRLFLDPAMVYSCAFYATGRETLEEAQRAKLDLVCRKLRLRRAERFLDIGCGWGALLAHAADAYGADATGITVSQNQLDDVRRRIASTTGDSHHIEVVAADYRTLEPRQRFHKIASVGMMEHVGRERLDTYFSAIERHLVPGGLFLNHAIADTSSGMRTIPWAGRAEGRGFIDRYIFPDGDLVPLGQVVVAAEKAGFEVRDVESLREHYAETLTEWLSRLEARFADAARLVGPRRARAYRLYLASSAVAFRVGRIGVYQMLLAKRTANGRAEDVPRCRAEWYDAHPIAGGAMSSAPFA